MNLEHTNSAKCDMKRTSHMISQNWQNFHKQRKQRVNYERPTHSQLTYENDIWTMNDVLENDKRDKNTEAWHLLFTNKKKHQTFKRKKKSFSTVLRP